MAKQNDYQKIANKRLKALLESFKALRPIREKIAAEIYSKAFRSNNNQDQ